MNYNQSKKSNLLRKKLPEINQASQMTDILKPGSLTIIDGTLPTGNIVLKAIDRKGKEFSFEGESSGKFTTEKEYKQFGSCELEMEVMEEVKQPSWNQPVTVKYNSIDIDSLDPNLSNIEFYTDEKLHNDPIKNKTLLLINDLDSEKIMYWAIDDENKNMDNNDQNDLELQIDKIKKRNYNKSKRAESPYDEIIASFGAMGDGLELKGFKGTIDDFEIVVLPALECEVGPNYTAYIMKDEGDPMMKKASMYMKELNALKKIYTRRDAKKKLYLENEINKLKAQLGKIEKYNLSNNQT